MDAKKLKKVLEEINNNPNANRDDIIEAGAICSILSYYEPNLKNVAVTDYVQGSRIDEEMQMALNEFVAYSKEKALELSNGVELHAAYAQKALERMLGHLSEFGHMLYRVADKDEKQAVKSAYAAMLGKMM